MKPEDKNEVGRDIYELSRKITLAAFSAARTDHPRRELVEMLALISAAGHLAEMARTGLRICYPQAPESVIDHMVSEAMRGGSMIAKDIDQKIGVPDA